MLPIFLVVVVDVFALTLVLPLLAIYAESFHASPLQATLLVSVFAACQLVAGPVLGSLSDRFGRKPLLVLSQAGTFLGLVMMAEARVLWVLYLARIIDGATAGNLSLAQAWISDRTAPEKRTKAFGIIGIAFGLGFFFGPWVTSLLVPWGLRAPIYFAALLSLTSIVCTLTLLPGGPPPQSPHGAADAGPAGKRPSPFAFATYAPLLAKPIVSGLLLQFFLFAFGFSTFTSGFALFAERRFEWHGVPFGPREVGWVFAYSGALGILLQGGLIGRLVKRYGDAALVHAGFVAALVGYAALGAVGSVAALFAVATVASFGQGTLRPALTSLISQTADAHEQGKVLGLAQSLGSVAAIFAPALGGLLLTYHALAAWAWVAAAASLLGLLASRWGSARVARHVRAA